MAVLQTARSAYARNLSQQLQNGNDDSWKYVGGDSI
jgi:hypothetical protein